MKGQQAPHWWACLTLKVYGVPKVTSQPGPAPIGATNCWSLLLLELSVLLVEHTEHRPRRPILYERTSNK